MLLLLPLLLAAACQTATAADYRQLANDTRDAMRTAQTTALHPLFAELSRETVSRNVIRPITAITARWPHLGDSGYEASRRYAYCWEAAMDLWNITTLRQAGMDDGDQRWKYLSHSAKCDESLR